MQISVESKWSRNINSSDGIRTVSGEGVGWALSLSLGLMRRKQLSSLKWSNETQLHLIPIPLPRSFTQNNSWTLKCKVNNFPVDFNIPLELSNMQKINIRVEKMQKFNYVIMSRVMYMYIYTKSICGLKNIPHQIQITNTVWRQIQTKWT